MEMDMYAFPVASEILDFMIRIFVVKIRMLKGTKMYEVKLHFVTLFERRFLTEPPQYVFSCTVLCEESSP